MRIEQIVDGILVQDLLLIAGGKLTAAHLWRRLRLFRCLSNSGSGDILASIRHYWVVGWNGNPELETAFKVKRKGKGQVSPRVPAILRA